MEDMKLKRHELSAGLPDLTVEELAGLEQSLLKIGQQDPICLHDGKVLDGWNRYTLLTKHGIPPRSFNLPDHISPEDYVEAKVEGRSLSAGQKALFFVLTNAYRETAGRPRKGNPAVTAGLPKTTKQLAENAGVGMRTVEQAKALVIKGSLEMIEAVRDGQASLEKAAQVLNLPKDEQAVALMDPESASAQKVRKERKEHPAKAPAPPADKPHSGNGSAGKPSVAPDFDDVMALHARIAELEQQAGETAERLESQAAMLAELLADLDAANKVIEADESAERIKAALAEAKRFRDAHRAAEDRIRGLQQEKNMAIQQAKKFQSLVQRRAH